MPLHFQSITEKDQSPALLTELFYEPFEHPSSLFVSKDKYLHSQTDIRDELSGDLIGKIVYTVKSNEEKQVNELLDLDIVLNNDVKTTLRFLALREGSSDSNEYYDAAEVESDGHLEIETVNRHSVEGDLVDTEREVSICAFPFELTVYEDIEAFNRAMGFDKEIKVGDTDMLVHGFSEKFIMPGGMWGSKANDESYTFLLGKVVDFRDVRWQLGKHTLDFVITRLDTALGVIPAAMGREVFDLAELTAGKIIAMNADIKADLARPEDYIQVMDNA